MLAPTRPRPAEVTSLPAYRMLTDERLAKLAANGNRAAFETIYARYHDTLFRYCRSLVRDDEDARDALQNTMLNAMAAMHRRDRSAPLRPWLFRIAHNESISLLRRRKPQESLDDDSEPHRELADGRCDVHETAVTNEQLDQLLVDLGELTERQRGALLMRELGGLGYGEIAAALETSEPAVRQSVFAARSALHESAEGRDLSCSSVQMSISAGDRRSIRGRRVSAHLRACPACRDFAGGIRQRRAHYGLLAPSPVLAASMFQTIFGAGGGAAAVGAGAAAAGGSAAAGSVAAKAIVALAAVGAAAGGTVEVSKLPSHSAPARNQTVAAAKSRVAAPVAPSAAAPHVVRVKAHRAPAAHRNAPASVRREAAALKQVDYRWRGAHKDPSGTHPNTKSDPFSPKHRPGVRGGQDIRVLLSHTNVTTLAVRLIDRWKAEQDARRRAEIVAELQQRMGTGPAAASPPAAPAEPAPTSEPTPESTNTQPNTAPPADESDTPPAESGSTSQDSDAPEPAESAGADAGTAAP